MKKYINFINEIFESDNIYNVKLYKDEIYESGNHELRYSFITKNNIEYKILLFIKKNGNASIDFDTIGLDNDDYSSMIWLINSHDSIKVFNTLKSIIYKHKEIKKLEISSTEERIKFYKKLLDYMKIKNKLLDDKHLIGYL
jgi:hypothetical protein